MGNKKKSLITINFNQFFKQRTETAVNRFYCFKDDATTTMEAHILN